MKLKVKTQDDRLFSLDLSPSLSIHFSYSNSAIFPYRSQVLDLKTEIQKLDSGFAADRFRVLFQGRFLEDENILASIGMEDGHTVLLVPKPAAERRNQRNPTTRSHPSLRRLPPEVLRFLHAQQRVFTLLQSQRGDRGGLPGPTDEELDAMESQTELENLGDIREGDSSDLVLGFAFGFLLGPIAGLCLIENSLSRHLRAGMLIGIICEVTIALFRMATHIPRGV
eukprot:g8182.t1